MEQHTIIRLTDRPEYKESMAQWFHEKWGIPKQAYTVHILPPIYPDPARSLRENERAMQEKHEQLYREVYERVYR